MPMSVYSRGALLTVAAALLLLPARRVVHDGSERATPAPLAPLAPHRAEPLGGAGAGAPPQTHKSAFDDLLFLPFQDLIFTLGLLILGFVTLLCEWIQRKLMEQRIIKLSEYLRVSTDRLKCWETQQENLAGSLRTAKRASAEYRLLLYLLLRRHRTAVAPQPHHVDKDLDDLSFVTCQTIDV